MSQFFLILIIIIAVNALFRKIFRNKTLKYGNQFIKKLELSESEILHLNAQSIPWGNFHYIDFCAEEVLKLYIASVRKFPELITKRSRDKEQRAVIRYCVWLVQNQYGYKSSRLEPVEELTNLISPEIRTVIDTYSKAIPEINEIQEKQLYSFDATRWKIKFEQVTSTFQKDSKAFYNEMQHLASLTDHSTARRAIYYNAYQFMADKDKEISAKLYIHYLSIRSESKTFKHQGINSKNKKRLFQDKIQESKFEKIATNFLQTGNINKALKAIEDLYTIKRKPILLNSEAIHKAQEEYDLAVGILNEFLTDENLPEPIEEEAPPSRLTSNNMEKNDQQELLDFFVLNDYKLIQKEVDIFAERKGLFPSRLINDINETYYDDLNDVLIEEETGSYIVNRDYYQQIKCR